MSQFDLSKLHVPWLFMLIKKQMLVQMFSSFVIKSHLCNWEPSAVTKQLLYQLSHKEFCNWLSQKTSSSSVPQEFQNHF
jgi:hypothetical protein